VSTSFLRRAAVALAVAVALMASTTSIAAAEPSAITRWYGDASSATGNSISQDECDVNGDDFNDLVVGAWFWDRGSVSNLGAAYVLFGGPEVQGGDLQNPSEYGAARIDGAVNDEGEGDTSAFSVACLGDVNADGLDDIGVSQYISEKIFVVLGAAEFGAVDLSLLGERGYEVHGSTEAAFDYNVGFSMSPVGDYDDDGIDDYAVAGVVYDRPAIGDQPARTNNGRIWIVAGKEDVANVDLIAPAEGEVLATIDGAYAEERLGSSSMAGDVNGDGIDDFVVGSYTSTPWGPSVVVPGQAYVVFGGSGDEIDLLTLGDEGFAIRGPQRGRDRLGISVDGAGDVNGDGLDDLLIGADGVYNVATGERPGTAWVVWGSASTNTVYTNPTAGTTVYSCESEATPGTCNPGDVQPRGYVMLGQDTSTGTASESTGYSVASAGDVNGDEVPDFIVGAYGYDPVDPVSVTVPPATMSGAGAVFVVYGKGSLSTRNLATLTPTQGYRVDGLAAGDRFGRQVGAPGDLDGNGVLDLVGAGDFAQRPRPPATPRTQSGDITLLLHGALETETTLANTATGSLAPGEQLTLTSTTNLVAAGGGHVATGTATFSIDGTPIAACTDLVVDPADGTADCVGLILPGEGTYDLTVAYTGTATRADSASESISQEVVATATDTTLETSATGAVDPGETFDLTSTTEEEGGDLVTEGTVTFEVDGTPIVACTDVAVDPADGTADCAATSLADAGTFDITAAYTGSGEYGDSESEAIEQEVTAVATSTELETSAAGPVAEGEAFDLSSTTEETESGDFVTTGTVTFEVDGTPIAACTDVAVDPADGTADCAAASIATDGTFDLTAVYSGTGVLGASTSNTIEQVVEATAADCTEQRFSDVSTSHPFAADICWMADEGISEGFPGSPLPSFQPSTAVTRQAMSAFMYRLAGSPDFTDPTEATFSDVGTGHTFFTEIEWMAAEEISTGYVGTPKPAYQPNAPVTRQAMSAFMYRLAGSPDFTDPTEATFSDVSTANTFFSEIEWMAAEDISEGFTGSPKPSYQPAVAVSRQAMSAFMHRLADGPGVGIDG
jgi:uncharacterized Zn-binding protein involved in type VI secretion